VESIDVPATADTANGCSGRRRDSFPVAVIDHCHTLRERKGLMMNSNLNNVTSMGFREVTADEMQAVDGGIWAIIGRVVFTAATFLARQGFSRSSHNGGGGDGPSCPLD
jgi:hypothetical protein